jgi:hypothetical protein
MRELIMANARPRPHEQAGTGAEDIPPGATRKAWDRPMTPAGGAPGSGAGPRHMSGDPGDGNEFADPIDRHREDDPTLLEEPEASDEQVTGDRPVTPYAGISGGNIHGGIAPGASHRGDSTIGSDPGAGSGSKGKKGRKKK